MLKRYYCFLFYDGLVSVLSKTFFCLDIQGDAQDLLTANQRTSDISTTPETGSNPSSRCILTIAFQFPFENNLQENVANMACQYVRSVISSVQRVAMAVSPSELNPFSVSKFCPGSAEAVTLALWICQSYK